MPPTCFFSMLPSLLLLVAAVLAQDVRPLTEDGGVEVVLPESSNVTLSCATMPEVCSWTGPDFTLDAEMLKLCSAAAGASRILRLAEDRVDGEAWMLAVVPRTAAMLAADHTHFHVRKLRVVPAASALEVVTEARHMLVATDASTVKHDAPQCVTTAGHCVQTWLVLPRHRRTHVELAPAAGGGEAEVVSVFDFRLEDEAARDIVVEVNCDPETPSNCTVVVEAEVTCDDGTCNNLTTTFWFILMGFLVLLFIIFIAVYFWYDSPSKYATPASKKVQ